MKLNLMKNIKTGRDIFYRFGQGKNKIVSFDNRKIYDQEIVEITLNEDALLNSNYKDELESSNLVNNIYGPHYRLEVSSIESFEKRYDDLISSLGKQNSYEIEYLTESRTDIYSFLQTWGFTILILIGFWFLLRRMSGGAGPGGQIFNISKSKASLPSLSNLFIKTIIGISLILQTLTSFSVCSSTPFATSITTITLSTAVSVL